MRVELIDRNYEKSVLKCPEEKVYKITRLRLLKFEVTFNVGRERKTCCVKDLVLQYCGGRVITKLKFNKFCDAWTLGKIILDYSKEKGLFIVK